MSPARHKFFVMDMFPYPSGAGLHVGHPLGYIATDVIGRYRRMCGDNVLHALGYDAFGLPAEQYAVQTGQHPRITTEANMAIMRRQLRRLGLGTTTGAGRSRPSTRLRPVDAVDLPADLRLLVRHRGRGRPSGGPGRSPSSLPSTSPATGRRRTAGLGRIWTTSSGAASSTLSGWPTSPRRPSTGARAWARCWPTRRSPPRAAPSAATSPCSSAACASG